MHGDTDWQIRQIQMAYNDRVRNLEEAVKDLADALLAVADKCDASCYVVVDKVYEKYARKAKK